MENLFPVHMRWTIDCVVAGHTEISSCRIFGAIASNPSVDTHKIGYKRRYITLQYSRIAFDNILGYNFCLIIMINDCAIPELLLLSFLSKRKWKKKLIGKQVLFVKRQRRQKTKSAGDG